MKRTIVQIVKDIQRKKEEFRIVPTHATFAQIKAETEGMADCDIYAQLDSAVRAKTLYCNRVISGFAYGVNVDI